MLTKIISRHMFNTKALNPSKIYREPVAEGRPFRQNLAAGMELPRRHYITTFNQLLPLSSTTILEIFFIIQCNWIEFQDPFLNIQLTLCFPSGSTIRSRSNIGRMYTLASMTTGYTYCKHSPSQPKPGWPVIKPSREPDHATIKYATTIPLDTAHKIYPDLICLKMDMF